MRFEIGILGFLLFCWLLFFSLAVAGYPLAGMLRLGLYPLYGLAVFLGWLLGNVVVHRSSAHAPPVRRRLVLAFLLCPGGLFYLLWSLAPDVTREAAPFAPLYAAAIFAIFFLVPVSFRKSFPARSIGGR